MARRISPRSSSARPLASGSPSRAKQPRRSRAAPGERRARPSRILGWARDLAQVSARGAIDVAHVLDAADRLEIDGNGLGPVDRKILGVLADCGRPVGIEAIAATLRLDADTVRLVHEPYLTERGYLIRTPRGRMATRKTRLACRAPKSP
jgi:Holliday junction DNA helicase RuvB